MTAWAALGTRTQAAPTAAGLEIMLPAATRRDVIAEINRILVTGGISVYRLQPARSSLESWFLQATSQLADPQ